MNLIVHSLTDHHSRYPPIRFNPRVKLSFRPTSKPSSSKASTNKGSRNLEATFYRQGLANFSQDLFIASGLSQTLYSDFQTVAKDESTHVDFLKKAISAAGAAPVAECTYNFPVTDLKSFIAVSSLLEGESLHPALHTLATAR